MGGDGFYGFIMHIIASGVFLMVAGLMYRKHKTKKVAIISMLIATIAMTLSMGVANYYITTFYLGGEAMRQTVVRHDAVDSRVQPHQGRAERSDPPLWYIREFPAFCTRRACTSNTRKSRSNSNNKSARNESRDFYAHIVRSPACRYARHRCCAFGNVA